MNLPLSPKPTAKPRVLKNFPPLGDIWSQKSMRINRLASIFRPEHVYASINDDMNTFLWDHTEKPQHARGNNKYTCLLQARSSGKSAEAYDHNHNPETGIEYLCINMWAFCKLDNHTDPLTHHRPHWHRHQCPSWRLPEIKQDGNSHCSPTNETNRKWSLQPQSDNISISALLLCFTRGWATHAHTQTCSQQRPLPEIV